MARSSIKDIANPDNRAPLKNGTLRFAARTGLLFGLRIGGAAAMFAVNLLIARHYGAEALGVFAICLASLGLLAAGLPFGFNAVGAYFAAEYQSLEQPGLLSGFIRAAFRHIAWGALFALAAGAALLAFRGALAVETIFMALCVWASAIAGAIMFVYGAVAIGLNHQFAGLIPETIIRPAITLLTIGAIVILVPGTPLWTFIALMTIGSWVAVLASYRLLRQPLGAAGAAKVEQDVRRWRHAAYPWTATTLLWDFMIDILLLTAGFFAPSVEIALLHVCFRFRVLAEFGVRSIQFMMIPDITSLKAKGQLEAMRKRLAQANLASAIYGVAVLAGFAVAGKWMLGLFGEEMVAGQGMLLVVSSTLLVRAVFGPAPQILAIFDKHMGSAVVMAGALLFAVALTLILYDRHGIAAVAYGYFAANLLVAVTLWQHARQAIGVDCSLFSVFGDAGLRARIAG